MHTITTIGLDIATSVFQVHGIDAQGKVLSLRSSTRRSFRRDHDHAATRAGPLDDDVSPRALDDGHDLGPLGRGDCELVERLCHVVHERVPLARCDAQVPMRALHVLAGVFLRTSGGPAQHLGNQVFEACRRYLVVRVVD
jgi:hypothetical protein